MRRWRVKAFAALTAFAVVLVASASVVLRRSLPQLDGTQVVSGLSAPLDIVRDRDAIPHIFAANRLDALFGLGYVHAQDRLWQMEFQRRIGFGRLSEIFGRVTLPQDRFLRTVGFGRAAQSAWAALPDIVRRDVDAYVAGVNAFIAAHRGARLPPEFLLLRIEPEPWTGADVIVWQKMMAWDLCKNFSEELLRDDIAAAVGPARLADLMPPYPPDGLSILSARDVPVVSLQSSVTGQLTNDDQRLTNDNRRLATSFAALASALSAGNAFVARLLAGPVQTSDLGSNGWVVDGTLTASRRPMLANDPHLEAHLPSTWYLAHMVGGEFDVIGATLPGTPVVAIGRNRFIAWGETNDPADVQDLYREHVDATGRFVEDRGHQEPLQVIRETIAVRNGPAVSIDVRISRHGPLVSDAINANNAERPGGVTVPPLEPLALRWTALDPTDTTVSAFLGIDQAKDWNEFTTALRDFVVPSQNFLYADVAGHIGYYAPGRIPIRAAGDGSRPADGWSGDAEWIGWVPFDELPHVFDPPEHAVVTANNRPAPKEYPYLLGHEWTEPYRAQRITDLIARAPGLAPDDMAAMQADTLSLHGKSVVPLLLQRAQPRDARDQRALGVLRSWDGDARGDSAGPVILQAWLLRLWPALIEDELGTLVTSSYLKVERMSFAARFLAGALANPDDPWCDDKRTPGHETCANIVSSTLHEAVADLAHRLGDDVERWRWDEVHLAVFPHQGLDAVPLLGRLLRRSVPHGGDWSTVNVGSTDADHPFDQHAIPSYRQVIDLAPDGRSRFLDAAGQGGHPLSPYYDEFLQDWRAVRYRPMRMDHAEIERDALGTLRLTPYSVTP